MGFRKILFWLHLSAGVLAGIVILIMSVTGVLLAFQRQITDFVDRRNLAPITTSSSSTAGTSTAPSIEQMLQQAASSAHAAPTAVTVHNTTGQPYEIEFGRERVIFVDPHSAVILGEGSQRIRRFFRLMTDLHRWLALPQESRPVGRAITGACNLLFLGIVLSGMYLWIPRKLSWQNIRAVLLFRGGLSGKARDFNWHNVFGIWCAIPLVIVVATAVVMSYTWANNALYYITGTQPPPVQRGGPEGPRGERPGPQGPPARKAAPNFSGLDALLVRAQAQDPTWKQITTRLPTGRNASEVSFTIINGLEGRPDRRAQLVLARDSGEVVRWEPFSKNNAGRRLRMWFRFLHTGEAAGIAGQAIAGIASAGAVFLVYTGITLAIRRLIAWNRRRKNQPSTQREENVESVVV